jgi:hypothetical protein
MVHVYHVWSTHLIETTTPQHPFTAACAYPKQPIMHVHTMHNDDDDHNNNGQCPLKTTTSHVCPDSHTSTPPSQPAGHTVCRAMGGPTNHSPMYICVCLPICSKTGEPTSGTGTARTSQKAKERDHTGTRRTNGHSLPCHRPKHTAPTRRTSQTGTKCPATPPSKSPYQLLLYKWRYSHI